MMSNDVITSLWLHVHSHNNNNDVHHGDHHVVTSYPVAAGLKVVEGEINADRLGHGDEMQHGVGGTTQRHHQRHCIVKGSARHDVTWLDVSLHQLQDGTR